MKALPDGPLIAWVGDDFTGSAAVMEVLTFAGLPSALFFDAPTPERLARFEGLRGIGVATEARSKGPGWMAERLPPIYAALRETGAPIVHYKVCSTFDSAPEVGSIGAAADLALDGFEWEPAWAPMIVAAPAIGRWQAFGNLFALAEGEAVRLDRHPTMSVHPVTPMQEADLRHHLSRQTRRGVGLVDLRALKAGRGAATAAREAESHGILALDVVDEETLAAAGALVWSCAGRMFAVGSQGLEYALVAAWREAGLLGEAHPAPTPRAVERVAVVSGSCSPVTAQQIAQAEDAGFALIPLDPLAALDPPAWERERGRAVEASLAALGQGRSPLVHTALGPGDPRVAAFREAAGAAAEATNARLGEGLGRVLDEIVRTAKLTRCAIAGGDTSSHSARGLGLWAVTAQSAVAPGAAILRGWSDDSATDGVEIALKGGQMGPPDFFQRLRAGGPGGTT